MGLGSSCGMFSRNENINLQFYTHLRVTQLKEGPAYQFINGLIPWEIFSLDCYIDSRLLFKWVTTKNNSLWSWISSYQFGNTVLYCTVFLTLSVKVTACFTKFHLIKGGYFLGMATRNRVLEKAALQQCNLIKARIIEVLETNVIPRRPRHQFFWCDNISSSHSVMTQY